MYYGFACWIELRSDRDRHLISDMTTAVIDNHLYRELGIEVCCENDTIIDNHPMMQAELDRQLSDLRLYQSHPINEAMVNVMNRARMRNVRN